MEEQKSKEVKIDGTQTDKQGYTYDELNDICGKLYDDNQLLKKQLQQMNKYILTIDRLDYLFKVVELANRKGEYCFTSAFVRKCYEEIEATMTIPKEDTNKEKES